MEQSIIDNLEKFLLELGKGFAFVARQQHIHTEKEDYYIDLVFYNIYLKCYVLIDLKTSKIRHQDVGQMDMYVRMYDQLKRTEGDNPTIGILLCDDTDEDIARYSVLHDNNHMFASKYMTYMPSPEQLRAEIERQKEIFTSKNRQKMKNKSLTPQIRFKGYDDKWQQAKVKDVFMLGNGYTPSKANPAFWTGGTIPWFRMEDIRENGRILSDSIQHVTPEAVKSSGLFPAGSIIVSTTATIGEHALLIADSLANQRFTVFKP